MQPIVFFGYSFTIEDEISDEVIRELYDLNGMIREPFRIFSIIPTYDDVEQITLVLGFIPNGMRESYELSLILDEYIQDNPLLECLTLSKASGFYAGVEWCPELSDLESYSSESSESSESLSLSESSEVSYDDDLTSEEST